ncbi:DUF5677 domain-containing protein [Vibrio parahaemolyticus]|uniref:DUF5677 domain-containing protein n=1 Tax=Vibrio parahaemolyticus TaxID=670 RepID=UPI003B676DAF
MLKNAIEAYTKQSMVHEAHLNHIPIIIEVLEELYAIGDSLNIESGNGMDSRCHRIQVRVLVNFLSGLMKSISALLSNRCLEGVDPLARVVMEHSVNIMYLFEGKAKAHSKQFMRNYIDTTLKKSERWYEYAKSNGDETQLTLAKNKLDFLKTVKEVNHQLYDSGVKKWPNAYDRFLNVGYEHAYVTLFAMNSDSVHSLSEDVYNYCLLPNYPEELQPHIARSYRAMSKSMSIYLAMKSVGFYGLALLTVSNRLNSSDDIIGILTKLNEVALEHEEEAVARWHG